MVYFASMTQFDPATESGRMPIEYGEAMQKRVRELHAGAEALPGYERWIEEHLGGRVVDFRRRLVPQILAFTDLRDLDVLDFGCGTGSTTVALAENAPGSRITAIDIDSASLEIAHLRFAHHGFQDRIEMLAIQPVTRLGHLPFAEASFDFILANGVLEHVVPYATRPILLREIWRLLRPGGLFFVSETPNPLWPIDRHTTGLPFVPWMPSRLAYRFAVACGRHRRGTDLDARGRRGMTYWEIVRPLEGCEVLNLTRSGNRLQPAGPTTTPSAQRRFATFVLERIAGRPLGALGIPALALGPFIEYLCLRKQDQDVRRFSA